MSHQSIVELEGFPEEERRSIYRKIEGALYRKNRWFLAITLIGGFFPGLAILGFIEAYRRSALVQEHPILIGVMLTLIISTIWIWKENYKDKRIAEEVKRMSKKESDG